MGFPKPPGTCYKGPYRGSSTLYSRYLEGHELAKGDSMIWSRLQLRVQSLGVKGFRVGFRV